MKPKPEPRRVAVASNRSKPPLMEDMPIGAMFPGDETGHLSRDQLDHWLDVVVECGYSHVSVGDHVVGVDGANLQEDVRREWMRRWAGPPGSAPYDHRVSFREPFVLFAYFAARCELGLATNVMVLPQRQTALVAKQAAEVDELCGGRLRLGFGTGWSTLEFEALGGDFASRGRMLDEQIDVLRRLWTAETVTFAGEFHTLHEIGLQPVPTQRPIPIWLGGDGIPMLRRLGRTADGWFPPVHVTPGERLDACREVIAESADGAGRSLADIEIEPRIYLAKMSEAEVLHFVQVWRDKGATRFCLDTRFGAAPVGLEEHCDRLRRAAALLGARVSAR